MIEGLVLALASGVALAGQDRTPVLTVPVDPPAISVSTGGKRREPYSVSWAAGEITCDNGVTFGAEAIPPRIPDSVSRAPTTQPRAVYSFTLGPEGRALSISLPPGASTPRHGFDLAPALAAAQLAPQAEPTRCMVTFTQTAVPYSEAPLADLVAARIQNRRVRIPREAWNRFGQRTCYEKRTRALEWHTPDFRKLPKLPGAKHWTFQTYDIDEKGRPTQIKTVGSSGSQALNDATRKATKASRFVDDDPREGCWRYTWTAAEVIPAPQMRSMPDYGEPPEPCDADDKWAVAPKLDYPRFFERRGIEGWVVFRYDVAPWGEIGNVEVVDAQPARDLAVFGQNVLTSARFKPIENGLSGCIERVEFRLPENGPDTGEDG